MSYANVTAPRDKGKKDGILNAFKMAVIKIFKGSIVTADSSGYATFGTVGASLPYLGVAIETVDNTGGSAGDKDIRCASKGVFSFVTASADQTWVGLPVWLSSGSSGNPQSVVAADPGATALKVGVVTEVVSATEVLVRIDGFALNTVCDAT